MKYKFLKTSLVLALSSLVVLPTLTLSSCKENNSNYLKIAGKYYYDYFVVGCVFSTNDLSEYVIDEKTNTLVTDATFSVKGSLPTGLSFDSATGIITSTTDIAIGTYNVPIIASSVILNKKSEPFNIHIECKAEVKPVVGVDGNNYTIANNNDLLTALCSQTASDQTITFNLSGGGTQELTKSAILSVAFGNTPIEGNAIGNYFCENCTGLDSDITIPSFINEIGKYFLSNCTNFNSDITIPDEVYLINSCFLYNCTSFNQKIILPSIMHNIATDFLYNCTSFNKPFTLPILIDLVGGLSFFTPTQFMLQCTSFNSVLTLPSILYDIEPYFLSGCISFNKAINLPSIVTTIGDDFLSSCSAFNNGGVAFSIPNSIQTIGRDFLQGCEAFNQTLDFSNHASLTQIGRSFLKGATIFNETLNFTGCIGLTGNDKIGEEFLYNADAVTAINFGAITADVLTSSNKTLATNTETAAIYNTGVTVSGTDKNAICTKFSDSTSDPYRNLSAAA